MNNCENRTENFLNIGLLILRITLGGLMLFHGVAKALGGIKFVEYTLVEKGIPDFIAYGVFLGEIVAPICIILGFLARPAALVYAFTMLVAICLVHGHEICTITATGGLAIELPLLYLLGGVVLFFTGAGKYAFKAPCSCPFHKKN